MMSQFVNMTFFEISVFLVSSLVTGPSFMSISLLVLELWQFLFITEWPVIQKSDIPSSELCLLSGDWSELWIPNMAHMSLMKSYWMLQNASVTAFSFSELLRENQQGVKLTPFRLGSRSDQAWIFSLKFLTVIPKVSHFFLQTFGMRLGGRGRGAMSLRREITLP